MERVSCVSWSAHTVIATTVGEPPTPTFTKPHIQSHIVADVELLPIALHVVCLVDVGFPGSIFLLVSDNKDAISWIAMGGGAMGWSTALAGNFGVLTEEQNEG